MIVIGFLLLLYLDMVCTYPLYAPSASELLVYRQTIGAVTQAVTTDYISLPGNIWLPEPGTIPCWNMMSFYLHGKR